MPKGARVPSAEEAPARDNREAILEAAVREIARKGVRGFRVEEVATDAGVSAPLLYYHFADRHGLIRAALAHAGERAPSSALRLALSGTSAYEAIESVLVAEFDDDPAVRDYAVVWGEVAASAVFDPELREEAHRVMAAWRSEVAGAIEAGVAEGSVRDGVDPVAAAEILVSLVDGLCTRLLSGDLEEARARELLRAVLARELAPTRTPAATGSA